MKSMHLLLINIMFNTYITSPVSLPDRLAPLSWLDQLPLINLFALTSSRLWGLWSGWSTVLTWPTFAYKPLRSHELEIGGLMIQLVYLTDIHLDCRRPTFGRATSSPSLSTSNPYMPRYEGPPNWPIPVGPIARGPLDRPIPVSPTTGGIRYHIYLYLHL